MPLISACIISFNEEKKLEDCLRSLQGVVDEIVIVDSLSRDKTLEIARRYTDRIFEQAFLGHIEQKNLAVSRARHDWVLSLDCDERLSPRLQEEILTHKASLNKHDAYSMPRRTFYIYRWLNHCWYPDRKIRLFNRQKAVWGGVNPHDHIEVQGHNIKALRGDIEHYSFDSVADHIATLQKFTDIGASEIIKRGKPVTIMSPLTHASWTFFRLYVLRWGFLDGFAGFLAAVLSFMHVFVKYSKVICARKSGRTNS